MQAQKNRNLCDQGLPLNNAGDRSQAESFFAGLSPDESLLILGARLEFCPPELRAMVSILKHDPDWSWVKDQSERLGIQPLLYRHFSQEGLAKFVPDEVFAFFKAAYHRQSIRSLRIHGQVMQILEAMNQANIPIILLKGAFLAKRIYGDIASRPMSDIDLLCRHGDVEVAQKVLKGLGYEQAVKAAHSTFHEQLLLTEIYKPNHLPVFSKTNAVGVELHTDIFVKVPRRTHVMDRVWEKAAALEGNDRNLFCLSVEHQILHLSNHLHVHLLSGAATLIWFCDIHAWVTRHETEIDWEKLRDIAESLGIASRVAVLFDLLIRYWNTPVPEHVVCALDPELKPVSIKWAIFVKEKRKKETVDLNFVPSRIRLINDVREQFGWGKSCYFVLRHLFPARAYMIKRYKPRNQVEIAGCYIRHFFQKFRYVFLSLFLVIRQHFKS